MTNRFVIWLLAFCAVLQESGESPVAAQSADDSRHYQWVAVENGEIPDNAVPFGETITEVTGGGIRRAKTYVARGYFDEQRTSIAVADHTGCRGTSIHGRSRERMVQKFDRFDVLVPAPGFRPTWKTIALTDLDRLTDDDIARSGSVRITVTFDGPEFIGFPVQFEWVNRSGSSYRPGFYSGPAAFPAERRRLNLRPVDSYDNDGDEGPNVRYLVIEPTGAVLNNSSPAPEVPPNSF